MGGPGLIERRESEGTRVREEGCAKRGGRAYLLVLWWPLST